MAQVDIVPGIKEHADFIGKNMRQADRSEIWATCAQRAEHALAKGLEVSEKVMTGTADGEPVVMWGVVRESFIPDLGVPWMLATNRIEDFATLFLRRCRAPLMELFSGYDKLENYVDARNEKSIKWLKFMGFNVEDAEPYGIYDLPFHRFWKESHV